MSEKKKQPWLTGEIFDGHYEVGHLIARGGMAEVYHGVDLWSNNPVAIKVLSPQLSADPSQQQKFFREERSLRQISHEHVVGVLGSGTQTVHGLKLMFIVLDYVHGCTLQQLLTTRPVLSVGETLDIIVPVAEGLSEVHAHRFIHRDIKPSNILLSSLERSIKLTDFGLTRRTDQSWTGELMGTPAYVAPEIVDPKASVGPGVDIFALGIVMFRMLAGRLPFTGLSDDQQIIYHNINTEIPSLAQFAPGIDSDIVGVVKWCTRKQASARPADGSELFEVLQSIRERLTQDELAYRAQSSAPQETQMWDDVEYIAERTGATNVLQRTSISGFKTLENDHDDSSWNETDSDFLETEYYEPQKISGVGPQPAPHTSYLEEFIENETGATFIDERGSTRYEPISASYRHESSSSAQEHSLPRTSQCEQVPPASEDFPTKGDPRKAPELWQPAPALPTVVLIFIGILLAFVVAGFVGWQIAQSTVQSGWFASWVSFVDSFSGSA